MSQTTSYCTNKTVWWPQKLPGASLDYTLDITDSIDPANDFVALASVACAPSGAGEIAPSNFNITTPTIAGVQHTLLTVTLSSGQQNRTYITQFLLTMADGRIFEFLVSLNIPVIIAGDIATVPPSQDFGTPMSITVGGPTPVQQYSLISYGITGNQQIGPSGIGLPPNAAIDKIDVREISGLAGQTIQFGSTSGASDVFNLPGPDNTVNAGGTLTIPVGSLARNWFSPTTQQLIFVSVPNSAPWGSSILNIQITYHLIP